MKYISKINEYKSFRDKIKNNAIGFVPTMGALHRGHLSLIDRAVKENDITIVSIFVNPKQFSPKEDFSCYPRQMRTDTRLLKEHNVKILFAPTLNSMYPRGNATKISILGLTNHLCGAPQSRGSDHFNGVALVVAKLFNIIRPTRTYFGMKDFQQLRVIEQMTKDLNFNVKVIRCKTVREKDGLALSSRNAYLTKAQRREAPRLYHALQQGRKLLTSNRRVKPGVVRNKVKTLLKNIPHSRIDYIELVNPHTLQKTRDSHSHGPILIAAGIWLGRTRLIDNVLVRA